MKLTVLADNRLLLIILFLLTLAISTQGQMRQMHIETDPDNYVKKVSLYSPSNGYVAFTKWIGYTTDSGRTFTKKFITQSNVDYNGYSVNLTFGFLIKGVKSFGQDTVIVYGNYGFVPAILWSTDQGNTFKLVYHSTLHPEQLTDGINDMSFPQNNFTGYAIEADRVIKTTNAGRTWTPVSSETNVYYDFIEPIDNNNIFVFSTEFNNRLVRISGFSRTVIPLPPGQITYAHFITTNKGWVSMNEGGTLKIYYTTNAFMWRQMNNSEVAPFNATKMKFINDSTGYALSGYTYTVYKTTDSGKIWEPLPREINFSYLGYRHTDLSFRDNNQFWAGGLYGLLEMTSNGGGTPIPRALFKIDTANVSISQVVKLVNYSKPGRQYKWFRNDTLISSDYHTTYTHDYYRLRDTIKLVVLNGAYSDTLIKYQDFPVPPDPTPTITSFNPVTGATGTVVTIKGTNFIGASAVAFGGIPAASYTVVSPTTITATVAGGASGKVTVTTGHGTAERVGFTYVPQPVIYSFTPDSAGPGMTVVITGKYFTGATVVSLGGTAATSFTIISDTLINAIVAIGSSGSVLVKTFGGTATLAGFTYLDPPTITSFNPTSGYTGTVVSIYGTYFTNASAVTFGDVPAASFTVVSPTEISAVVGSGTTGAIKVVTPRGTAKSNLIGAFYFRFPPVITSFTPGAGGNGTSVTINGSSFIWVTSVSIGGVPAKSFVKNSDTKITAVVDIGATGDIIVTSPYGADTMGLFRWYNPPIITSFTPASGIAGTEVTITGNNFDSIMSVSVGGALVSSYIVVSPGTIKAIIGNGSSGSVMATNPAGSSSLAGFTFIPSLAPTITSFAPASGTAGTPVVITGTNFNPVVNGNTVYFGAVKAEVTQASSTSLTVTVPVAATHDHISVTVNNLTAYTSDRFLMTFAGPGTITPATFATRTDSVITFSSGHVKNVDLDGDGKTDILLCGSNGISVYRNSGGNGIVAFDKKVDFATTVFSAIAGTGDLDGDGKIDIIVPNTTGSNVAVLRNTGSVGKISFAGQVNIATGNGAYDAFVYDLNGDGKPEMIVPNLNSNTVSVLTNTSQGATISFAPKTDLAVLGGPKSVTVADVDRDGKPDIIVACMSVVSWNPNIVILKNTSSGSTVSFAPRVAFNAAFAPSFVSAGDLDGDGKPDIVASNANGCFILKNNSDDSGISFVQGAFFQFSFQGSDASTIGDLDGDGKLDISVTARRLDSVFVYKNLSDGGNLSFASQVALGPLFSPKGITIGDFDGDEKPDMAVVSANSAGTAIVSILKNSSGTTVELVQLCAASDTSLSASMTGASYQWQYDAGSGFADIADNQYYAGTGGAQLQLNDVPANYNGYSYRCKVDGSYSKIFTLHVKPLVIPSVQVTVPAINICMGTSVTFTAMPSNGGSSPAYQWMVNGNPAAINSNTFTTDTLTNGAAISVLMSGNAACASTPTAISNTIQMTVNDKVTPTAQIVASVTEICAGMNVEFTATGVHAGTSPAWQWQKNGQNVGINSNKYASDTLSNGDQVKVLLTSNASCLTTSDAVSNLVAIQVNALVTPSVNISGDTVVNQGQPVTVTAAALNGGPNPLYQWQDSTDTHSWANITDAKSASLVYTPLATGNRLRCILTSNAACANPSSVTSASTRYIVNTPTGISPDPANEYGIRLYPNPVSTVLAIEPLQLSDQWETLEIIDQDGKRQLIQNIRSQSKVLLGVSRLSPGIYIALLRAKNGKAVYLKFLKM